MMRASGRGRAAVRRRALAALAAAATAALAGCSDDVVCPDGVAGSRPYVAASVVETRGASGARTVGTAFCSADTLPAFLIVSVNDREFPHVGSGGAHGLQATLEDDELVWAPGTACALEVTTDRGIAAASAVVPGVCVVAAPESAAVGAALLLTWTGAASADYYEVRAVLRGTTPGDSVSLFTATEDTTATLPGDDLAFAGTVVGRVFAVSGPFPEAGAEGNVTGAGFGFFTVAFSDSAGAFEVPVTGAP